VRAAGQAVGGIHSTDDGGLKNFRLVHVGPLPIYVPR
jgi:hypothetical protein